MARRLSPPASFSPVDVQALHRHTMSFMSSGRISMPRPGVSGTAGPRPKTGSRRFRGDRRGIVVKEMALDQSARGAAAARCAGVVIAS